MPDGGLARHGLRVATPDELLAELMGAYQAEMIGILREARLSLKHPPLDAAEYLEILRVQGLGRTCGVLGRFLDKL